MRVAVTGASGFVGRHVVAALLARGVDVVATSRTKRVDQDKAVRWVPIDLANPPADAFDRLGRPDALMHLAWEGLPNYRSRRHYEVELPRQYAFLHGLADAGLRHLVVTGTCYEYGMLNGELSESIVGVPTNPYGFAKLTLLRQLQFLSSDVGLALTWARLFYMYGPGQAAGSLLPQLEAAVARGDSSFAMSRGDQLRDYLPVDQVAERLARLALHPDGIGVVNICSGRPISVRALVESEIAAHRWSIELELGRYPYPDYEPLAFWGTSAKFDALLGDERRPDRT